MMSAEKQKNTHFPSPSSIGRSNHAEINEVVTACVRNPGTRTAVGGNWPDRNPYYWECESDHSPDSKRCYLGCPTGEQGQKGMAVACHTCEAFGEIVNIIESLSAEVGNMASTTQELGAAAEEIDATTEQMAASSLVVAEAAETVDQKMKRFKFRPRGFKALAKVNFWPFFLIIDSKRP